MAVNASLCFYPDGVSNGFSTNPNFVPCDPSAAVSACCAITESCVGNGLCYSNSGLIYRGACTDPTWKSPQCARACTGSNGGANGGSQNGFHFLQQCSATPSWTCDGDCSNSPFTLQIGPMQHVNITGNVTQPSAIPVPSQCNATQPSSCPTAPVSDYANVTAIGAGIGVPLGVLMIAAAITAFIYRRKWLSTRREMVSQYEHVHATPYLQQEQHHNPAEVSGHKEHAELSAQPLPSELETNPGKSTSP